MAVASLTINYDREQAIDFTKPFMTFGIAILYRVPEKEDPHMLSFAEPIKYDVWGTVIGMYVDMYVLEHIRATAMCKANTSIKFGVNQFENLSVYR